MKSIILNLFKQGYDFYNFANGKFSTIDGDVKLIKKE